MAIFQVISRCLLKQRMMEVLVTTGAISRAKLHSQIIITNKPTPSFFTGLMPFLSPNQQCQSTEGKISHSMDLVTPSSPGVLSQEKKLLLNSEMIC